MAYKQDIADYRVSPAVRVIHVLKKEGVTVDYYDPWVPKYLDQGEEFESVRELTPEILQNYDFVMITTAHSNVDYQLVADHAKAVFDTKNVMKHIKNRENIEVL